MTEVVSDQVRELRADFASSLERLQMLIDNRGAWSDAIEGCREAVTLLAHAATKLKAIDDSARQLEVDLAAARAETASWNRLHSDLSTVERDLRAELQDCRADLASARKEAARCKASHAQLAAAEKELRKECEQHRSALEQQGAALANARLLAKQLISETA